MHVIYGLSIHHGKHLVLPLKSSCFPQLHIICSFIGDLESLPQVLGIIMIFKFVEQGLCQGASYHEPSLGVSLKNGVFIRAILSFWFGDRNTAILNDPPELILSGLHVHLKSIPPVGIIFSSKAWGPYQGSSFCCELVVSCHLDLFL